ncbi:MAG: dehydrogenase, partial [Akkermansiaceae bacterium]|nr:dehydrogenase [Akkermansiaceae bacterium]
YGHGEGGAGKRGSRALYGGHAHVGAMIYYGDNWPDEYRGHLFTHNLHGRQMNRQVNKRFGSGYETVHSGSDHLLVPDSRFMGVELKYGPDGAVYMTDWQDQQHCHNTREEIWDRSDGGIYRMAWEKTWKPAAVDLRKRSTGELVELLFHRNEWYGRTARRILQERGDQTVVPVLRKALREGKTAVGVLRALWALHAVGAEVPVGLLDHADEAVRAWAVRLTAQTGKFPGSKAVAMAANDPSQMVRLALASALADLDESHRWEAAEALA